MRGSNQRITLADGIETALAKTVIADTMVSAIFKIAKRKVRVTVTKKIENW